MRIKVQIAATLLVILGLIAACMMFLVEHGDEIPPPPAWQPRPADRRGI